MQYTVDSGQFDSSWDSFTAVFSKTGISLVLFGIYVNLFWLSIYTLARRRGIPRQDFLIAASSAMAVMALMQIAVGVAQIALATRFLQESVRHAASNPPQSMQTLQAVSNELLTINVAATDIFFMYRCYVVWGYQRKVLILPTLLMLATLGTATIGSLSCEIPAAVIPCGPATATNIVLTTLTAGRILWVSRQPAPLGLSETNQSCYKRAIRIILESGALYCVATIFLLIAASKNSLQAFDVGYAMGQQAVASSQNIIPTFTLVYVGLQGTADGLQIGSDPKHLSV
ncbi:hypothetical protein MSAN_02104700 [Mycena sanguinolenta]|uniref:Uncharacterized protein n=1 Tax=Mycena sanguinolenta TaxID=230812 RepID=A0A8H6XHR9_9AGAR|nr:hypothetical protein MSAN_02104700 [Mycena sanguinolenta]